MKTWIAQNWFKLGLLLLLAGFVAVYGLMNQGKFNIAATNDSGGLIAGEHVETKNKTNEMVTENPVVDTEVTPVAEEPKKTGVKPFVKPATTNKPAQSPSPVPTPVPAQSQQQTTAPVVQTPVTPIPVAVTPPAQPLGPTPEEQARIDRAYRLLSEINSEMKEINKDAAALNIQIRAKADEIKNIPNEPIPQYFIDARLNRAVAEYNILISKNDTYTAAINKLMTISYELQEYAESGTPVPASSKTFLSSIGINW